jgi:dienelactone hydrolase/Flp pilus assembly protein TadD
MDAPNKLPIHVINLCLSALAREFNQKKLLPVALSIFCLSSFSNVIAADDFAKGTIIESVACKQDAGQSYALYLPPSYTPEKRWPIVYGFDPGARGRLPVELFQEAAEKYGYILVGSNNSRNGPVINLSTILQTIWEDTHARLQIDERRVYAAGMSGGARVALTFAHLSQGQVAGVVACSAGFPPNITPSASLPFVIYGTAGTDDFNEPELFQLDLTLESFGIPHRIEMFEGGHGWPPHVFGMRAIEWLELQAMRAGRRVRDEAFVEEQFKRRLAEARGSEEAKDFYKAYADYRALAEFKGLKETSEFEKKAAQMKESKETKAALAKERETAFRQHQREVAIRLYQSDSPPPAPGSSVEAEESDRITAEIKMKSALENLRKEAQEKKDSTERRVARRVLEAFNVQVFQEVATLFQQKNYKSAAIKLEIAAQLQPNDAGTRYVLARAYALDGRKKKALASLREAVERGFNDLANLKQNKAFDELRNEAEYKKLVEELEQKK